MGKLIKFLVGLLLVLILLVAAAALILPRVIDPNDYKAEIIAEVKQATGRDLRIDGNIGLSVFPWLGVDLAGVSLSQPAGFGDEPFAAVEQAQVRAKLMPLLKKTLEVDTIVLDGVHLRLVRNAAGFGNWQDLTHADDHAASHGERQPENERDKHNGGLASLAIGGIRISDALVSWDDQQTGQQVTIQDFSLTSGQIVADQPIELAIGFSVDNKQPALRGRVALNTTLTASGDGARLVLSPLQLRLTELQAEDGLRADVTLIGGLIADIAAQRFQAEELNVEARINAKQLPSGPLQVLLDAGLDVDLQQDVLSIDGLRLQAAGLDLTGRLDGRALQADPQFSGRLALAEFDLRSLLARLGMAPPLTADAEVLKRVGVNVDLKASSREAALEGLRIRLDDSLLNGDARVILSDAPGYRFALQLDAIDLDRYLPPADEPQAPQPVAQDAAGPQAAAQPLFPVELLRQLDVDGSFQVKRLVVSRLKLNDARIKVTANRGKVKVEQKVGSFYQGSLGGAIEMNVAGKTPLLHVAQRIEKIQAEPLMQDVLGQAHLAGAGNLNLDLRGSGQMLGDLKRSLNGTLDFAFTDGAVKGVNLGRLLREAAARLKGKTLPPDSEANQTDFSELTGSAVITQGVLRNEDLSAKSPLFRLTGKGSVNIAEDTLDYKLKPVLVASVQGQGGKDLEQLRGVPIPVHLTGPLTKPDWRIDVAEALTGAQKQKLKGKVSEELKKKLPQELQDKIPGGLDKQLDGALKGLFN